MVRTAANYSAIKKHLFDRIHKTGEQVKIDLPNMLRTAIQEEIWLQFRKDDGTAFSGLFEWLHYTWPAGVSLGLGETALTYEELMKLCEGHPDVYRVLAEQAPKGKPGPKPNGEIPAARQGLDRDRGGNRTTTLAARLAEKYPRFYDAYLRQEYRSIRAAAEAAGLVKPGHDPLQRLKSNWRKATAEQRQAFLQFIKEDG